MGISLRKVTTWLGWTGDAPVRDDLDQAKVMAGIEQYLIGILRDIPGDLEFRAMRPGAKQSRGGGTCVAVGDGKGDPFDFHVSYVVYNFSPDRVDEVFDQFVALWKERGWFEGIYAAAPESNDPARSVNGVTEDGYNFLASRSTPGGLTIKAASPLFPAPPSGRKDESLFMPFALTKDGPKSWGELKHEYDSPPV